MGRIRRDPRTGWYIADYVDAAGRRVRHKASRDRREAQRMLIQLEGQAITDRRLGIRPLKRIRFEEFAEVFLAYARSNMRAWKRYETSVGSLKAFFGNRELTAIDAASVEQYKMTRAGEVMQSTVNRDLQCLRRMLNLAIQWDYLRDSPMKKVKLFRESLGRIRYLTREEFARLVEVCPEHLRPLVTVAVHTGMRQGELLALTWSDIDFENGFASVNDPKNADPRKVPLNLAALEALRSVRLKNSVKVFTDADGQPLAARTLQWQFRRALREARVEGFRFHDLRHTSASWMAMAGVPILTIKEILGHKDIRMTLRYAHLAPDQRVDAVHRLFLFAQSKSVEPDPTQATGKG